MTSTENSIIINNHKEIESRGIFLTSDERYDVWNVKSEERPHLLNYDCSSSTMESSKSSDSDQDHGSSESSSSQQSLNEDDKDSDEDSNESLPLPLLDGCDLPGWRKEGLVSYSSISASSDHQATTTTSHYHQQGFLNVGLGCTLLRRESQVSACLPNIFLKETPWKQLQAKLLEEPPSIPGTAKGGPLKSAAMINGRAAAIRLLPDETKLLTGPHPWFEKQNVPVILEGCTADWKAMETCTWQNLLKEYGDYQWRFSDTHGACMSLETYTKYTRSIEGLTDDAPLAVYDSQLHLDERVQLLQDYQVPPCFDGMDLFQDVMVDEQSDQDRADDKVDQEGNSQMPQSLEQEEESTRSNNSTNDHEVAPSYEDADSDNALEEDSCSSHSSLEGPNPPPYRWILMGPERSGTGLHIDPLGTHAWVTVVEGCKRWVLFPPDTDQAAIGMQDPQIPSSIWFAQWYPRLLLKKEWNTTYQGAVEVLQRPGETVYVPAGWPHLVLNLSDTVAITHNYASEYPQLSLLQEAVKQAEPELYQVWWPKLKERRPDLFVGGDDDTTTAKSGEEKKED